MPKLVSKEAIRARQKLEFMRIISGAMGYEQMNQADIAKKLGVERSTVNRWLKDVDKVSFGNIRDLAETLGIKIIFEGKWQQ